jgi:AcrR family transcriptional regulator
MKGQRAASASSRGPETAGPGRPRDPSVDRAILTAALKLFEKRGFDGVSFEEVAETAGVARTTLYRRWSSKLDLIGEAIATERGAPEVTVATRAVSARSLREPLVKALSNVLTAPGFRRVMARLIGSVPDHPELMSAYWDAYLAPRRQAIQRLLERARSEGLIRTGANLEILLDLISGALMHHLLVRPGKHSAGEVEKYLDDLLAELQAGAAP